MIYLWDDGPRSWQGYCSGVKVGIDFFAKIRVEAVHDQLYSDIGFPLPPSTAIVREQIYDVGHCGSNITIINVTVMHALALVCSMRIG